MNYLTKNQIAGRKLLVVLWGIFGWLIFCLAIYAFFWQGDRTLAMIGFIMSVALQADNKIESHIIDEHTTEINDG
jgi:hypothetical protein